LELLLIQNAEIAGPEDSAQLEPTIQVPRTYNVPVDTIVCKQLLNPNRVLLALSLKRKALQT
jgi:hypothetical protein